MISFRSNRPQVQRAIDDAVDATLEAIGLYVEGEAILRCPVDTGNLKGSLTHKVDKPDKEVHIGTNVDYAAYVEKGTSRMRAQPYLEPAVMNNVSNIKQIAERGLQQIDGTT
jgi:HK97 gp10 family phage protein